MLVVDPTGVEQFPKPKQCSGVSNSLCKFHIVNLNRHTQYTYIEIRSQKTHIKRRVSTLGQGSSHHSIYSVGKSLFVVTQGLINCLSLILTEYVLQYIIERARIVVCFAVDLCIHLMVSIFP